MVSTFVLIILLCTRKQISIFSEMSKWSFKLFWWDFQHCCIQLDPHIYTYYYTHTPTHTHKPWSEARMKLLWVTHEMHFQHDIMHFSSSSSSLSVCAFTPLRCHLMVLSLALTLFVFYPPLWRPHQALAFQPHSRLIVTNVFYIELRAFKSTCS